MVAVKGDPPEELLRAVELVVSDLEAAGPTGLRVTLREHYDDELDDDFDDGEDFMSGFAVIETVQGPFPTSAEEGWVEAERARERGAPKEWHVRVAQGRNWGQRGIFSTDPVELLRELGDSLSDEYVDHLWEAKPKCPFHEHPLQVGGDDHSAWWECPKDSDWHRPIGSLASDAKYLAAVTKDR